MDDTDSKSLLHANHEQYEKGLRHCFATHLYDSGTDLCVIQELLGHYDLKETIRYIHLSNRHMKALVNPLDQLPQFVRVNES